MSRRSLGAVTLFVLLHSGGWVRTAGAQFYGSLYSNLYYSSNIFGLDTLASGDEIWENSITLGYQLPLSSRASILSSVSYSPQLYFANSDRSFSNLYLSTDFRLRIGRIPPGTAAADEPLNDAAASDALTDSQSPHEERASIERAMLMLYDAVNALDSIHGASTFDEAAKDSLSELVFTVADLIDSAEFGSSVKAVVLDELRDAEPGARQYSAGAADNIVQAITILNSVTAVSSFDELLGAFDAPEETAGGLAESSYPDELVDFKDQIAAGKSVSSLSVPPNLRVPISSSLKYLTAESITLREDAWQPSATTFLSLLRLPVYFSDRRDRAAYTSLDYNPAGAGLSFTTYPWERMSLSASLTLGRTRYAEDSVYSNNISTLIGEARIGLGSSTAILLEAGAGAKHYTSPLSLPVDPRNPRAKPEVLPSEFSQYIFGGGIVQDLGESVSVGIVGAFTRSPDLRAYLVDLTALRNRYTSGISDDEYSYDMSRGTALLMVRTALGIDVGLTLRREHRKYGPLILNQRGKPINDVVGASRIEDETRLSAAPSRYFYFDSPLIGIFEMLQLRGEVEYVAVESSLADYSYSAFNSSISFELSF